MPKEKEVPKPLLGSKSTGVVAGGIGLTFFAALAALGSSIFIAIPVGAAVAGGWLYALKPPSEKKPKPAKTEKSTVVQREVDTDIEEIEVAIKAIRQLARNASRPELGGLLISILDISKRIADGIPTSPDPLPKANLLSNTLQEVVSVVTKYSDSLSETSSMEKLNKKAFRAEVEGDFLPFVKKALENLANRLHEQWKSELSDSMSTTKTRLILSGFSGNEK